MGRTSGWYWVRTSDGGWVIAHFQSVNGDGYWRICGSALFMDDFDLSAQDMIVGPRIEEPAE